MHRTIDLTVASTASDAVVDAQRGIEGLVGLSCRRRASRVPPGGAITVHALNRAVDDLLRAARDASGA